MQCVSRRHQKMLRFANRANSFSKNVSAPSAWSCGMRCEKEKLQEHQSWLHNQSKLGPEAQKPVYHPLDIVYLEYVDADVKNNAGGCYHAASLFRGKSSSRH